MVGPGAVVPPLADDGLACLLGRRRGGAVLVHLPDLPTSRHLVSQPAVPWALRNLVRQTVLRRAAASVPSFARLVPQASALVRAPGSRPLLDWLPGGPPDGFVLTASPRGRFAIRLFRGGRPTEVARLGGRPPPVGVPGVATPELVASADHHGAPLVVETAVPGRPAALVLGERPRELSEVVRKLATWLEHWSSVAATERVASADLLERELLAPARALGDELPPAYRPWLERRCAEAEGMALPAVTTHNDLTMANVLLGRSGDVGVVDWDTARPDGLPLVDFLYAAVDAHAAADRYRDPAASFDRCFASGDVEELRTRLAAALELDPRVAELCFHACWLGHAANEAARPEGTRPFLRIVRRVAEQAVR